MRVHFMGITGSGQSTIAGIAQAEGYEVSGCDLKTGGHDVKHLENVDVLAVTPAVFFQSAHHPELTTAQSQGIAMTGQEFMGKYLQKNKFVIGIAGTVGKSTTTALAGLLLEKAGLDPTVFVGAVVPAWQQSFRAGKSKYFVVESDEFYGNFLSYHPDIVILNNIELDHPEYFGTFAKMLETYAKFISQIKPGGTLIYNADNPGIQQLLNTEHRTLNTIPYSVTEFPKNLTLKIPGDHNKANAMGIIKLAKLLKIPKAVYEAALGGFTGVNRRLQELGTIRGVTVVDDYANLPSSFNVNIKALKEKYPGKPIWAVIEPHTFSRLRAVLSDLAPALKDADHVIISKIFASREADPGDFTGADIAATVPGALYIPEFPSIVEHLTSNISSPAVILVMGSGNSDKLAMDILANL